MSSAAANAVPESRSAYLRFNLGEEVLAVPLDAVTEIVQWDHPTPVPGTPPWIVGVINLRGRVLPVVDIAQKLGLGSEPDGRRTALLVMDVDIERVHLSLAVRIDLLRDIVDIPAAQIGAPPEFGGGVRVEYLQGIWRAREGAPLLRLVDIIKMFSAEELLESALVRGRREEAIERERAAERRAAAESRKARAAARAASPSASIDASTIDGAEELEEGIFVFD